jgi:hypothetical protein
LGKQAKLARAGPRRPAQAKQEEYLTFLRKAIDGSNNRGGGLQEMLKIRQATGRYRVIPSAVIAGTSQKLSEESCAFKSYK